MTLNDVMALILRYLTEFVYAVVVKQLLGLFSVSESTAHELTVC